MTIKDAIDAILAAKQDDPEVLREIVRLQDLTLSPYLVGSKVLLTRGSHRGQVATIVEVQPLAKRKYAIAVDTDPREFAYQQADFEPAPEGDR